MEDILSFFQSNGALVQIIAAIVTAFGTAVLAIFTYVLAKETRALARATANAHVTATLEPNQWAMNYFDILVHNSGNAPAYDITIKFDPEIPDSDKFRSNRPPPFSKVSLLRPEQHLQSALVPYETVKGMEFQVTVSWAMRPKSKHRESITYQMSMHDYDNVSQLGARSPAVQIAEQVKKLREDWRHVASGSRKLSIDTYSSRDRQAKLRAIEEQRERRRRRQAGEDDA